MALYTYQDSDITNGQTDLFLNPHTVAHKLDAEQYYAEDLDGVTEGLFGSGNMNYLSLQAGQTDAVLGLDAQIGPYSIDAPIVTSGLNDYTNQFGDKTILSGEGSASYFDSFNRLGDEGQNEFFGSNADDTNGYTASTVGSISASDIVSGVKNVSAINHVNNDYNAGGTNGQDGNDGTDGNDGNNGNNCCPPSPCDPVIIESPVDVNLALKQIFKFVTELGGTLTTNINNITNTTDNLINQTFELLGNVDLCLLSCSDLYAVTDLITQVLNEAYIQTDKIIESLTSTIDGLTDLPNLALDVQADVVDLVYADLNVVLNDTMALINGEVEVADVLPVVEGYKGRLIDKIEELQDSVSDLVNLDGYFADGADQDVGLGADLQNIDTVVDVDAVIDPVEDLVGDVDTNTDLGLDLLGESETDNAAGDQDADLLADVDLLDHDIIDTDTNLNLDKVEEITGDIDLTNETAVDLLGDQADPVLDSEDGGSAENNLFSDVGDAVSELISDVLVIQGDESTDVSDLDSTIEAASGWTQDISGTDGLYDDLNTDMCGALPEPDGNITEGLGVLDVDPELDVNGLGGVFG